MLEPCTPTPNVACGPSVQGRPIRRLVLHRGPDHRDLLPAELSRRAAQGGEHDASTRAPPPASRRGSGPASGAAPTPVPALRSGTPAPTSSPAPCGSSQDGVVDREGVPGLAARLGYCARQIERQLSPSWARGRSPWPAPSARRPPGCSSRRRRCRWPRSPSRRVSPRSGPSTTRCARSSRCRPSDLRTRTARSGRSAAPRTPGVARAPAALPRAPEPGQPLRAPRRDRGTRRRGVAGRRVPPHSLAPVRARHRRPLPAPGPHRLPALPHRPARPDLRHQRLPPDAGPGRRSGRRGRTAARRPAAGPAGRQGSGTPGAAYRRRRRVRRTGGARPAGLHGGRPYACGPAGHRARRARRGPGGRLSPTSSPRRRRSPPSTRRRWPCRAAGAPPSPRSSRPSPTASLPLGLGSDWDEAQRAARRPAGLRTLDGRVDRDAGARRPRRLPPHRPRRPPRRRGSSGCPRHRPRSRRAPRPGGPGVPTPSSTCGPPRTTPSTTSPCKRPRGVGRRRVPMGGACRRRRPSTTLRAASLLRLASLPLAPLVPPPHPSARLPRNSSCSSSTP